MCNMHERKKMMVIIWYTKLRQFCIDTFATAAEQDELEDDEDDGRIQ